LIQGGEIWRFTSETAISRSRAMQKVTEDSLKMDVSLHLVLTVTLLQSPLIMRVPENRII
jgi:hypothetical protein